MEVETYPLLASVIDKLQPPWVRLLLGEHSNSAD